MRKHRSPMQRRIVEAGSNSVSSQRVHETITVDAECRFVQANCVKLEICVFRRPHKGRDQTRYFSKRLAVNPRDPMPFPDRLLDLLELATSDCSLYIHHPKVVTQANPGELIRVAEVPDEPRGVSKPIIVGNDHAPFTHSHRFRWREGKNPSVA